MTRSDRVGIALGLALAVLAGVLGWTATGPGNGRSTTALVLVLLAGLLILPPLARRGGAR